MGGIERDLEDCEDEESVLVQQVHEDLDPDMRFEHRPTRCRSRRNHANFCGEYFFLPHIIRQNCIVRDHKLLFHRQCVVTPATGV